MPLFQKPIKTGWIISSGGPTIPDGYLACDGTAVSRTTFAGLFAEIGVTHGAGDGSTTFNVPDTRRRPMIGVGTGAALGAVDGVVVGSRIFGNHSHAPGTFSVTGTTGSSGSQAVGILSLLSSAAPPNHTHSFSANVAGTSANALLPYIVVTQMIRI